MSFLLIASACIAAAGAAGVAFGRRNAMKATASRSDPDPAAAKKATEARELARMFLGMPLSLGDVVSHEASERWLSGAIVAEDRGQIVAAIFVAPEGSTLEAVVCFPAPRGEIFWLSPIDVSSGREPPTAYDFGGVVMQRRSRIPVHLKRLGVGAPEVAGDAVFAEYEASGRARGVLLRLSDRAMAWSGKMVDKGEFDRLGKGDSE